MPYRFSGEHDALLPGGGNLLFDSAGNAYGTTYRGGDYGLGTVYELTKSNGVWRESVLYSFGPGTDASVPGGGLVMDAHGNLYGTTQQGGQNQCQGVGCGTVFELTPSGSGWTETVIHSFQGSDGRAPNTAVTLGSSGEIYGGTTGGGSANAGVLFELIPSDGGWNFSVLYQFSGNLYGGPYGPLVLDAAGNLYGTTISDGANGLGSVFKLTHSNGGWSYTALHDFTGADDGKYPRCGPAFDSRGNLYGTAVSGGTGTCGGGHMCGTVWEIIP